MPWNVWWKCAQQEPSEIIKCQVDIEMLLGRHVLNYCLYKHKDNDIANPRCSCCMTYEIESVYHLLFKCNYFADRRKMLWDNVVNKFPPEMLYEEMGRMSYEKVTTYILSVLNNTYTPEWKEFYSTLLMFITSMYDLRWNTKVQPDNVKSMCSSIMSQ